MQNTPNRRAVVAGLALTPAAALPVIAGESDLSVHRLWDDWRALIGDYFEVNARREAAENSLPFWAQPGPGHLHSDGSYRGDVMYAPLDTTITPPDYPDDDRVFRNVRRTLADCRNDFEFLKYSQNEAKAKSVYRSQLRQLARVRIALLAERRKLGLPQLDQEQDHAADRVGKAAHAILKCPSVCPDAVAAKIVAGLWVDSAEMQFERIAIGSLGPALKVLQPLLTGHVREDVALLVRRADEGEDEMA